MIRTQRLNALAKQIRPEIQPLVMLFKPDPRVPEYEQFPVRGSGNSPEHSIAWNCVRRLWNEQVEANIQAAHPDMDFRMIATGHSREVAQAWAERNKATGNWDSAEYAREAAEAHEWAVENGFEEHELDVPV